MKHKKIIQQLLHWIQLLVIRQYFKITQTLLNKIHKWHKIILITQIKQILINKTLQFYLIILAKIHQQQMYRKQIVVKI